MIEVQGGSKMLDVGWESCPLVRYWPWIGEQFGVGENRLLVLGESHYGATAEDNALFTRNVVSNYLATSSGKFFTNISQALEGKHRSNFDVREPWRRIAFYNYVQTFVGETARLAPSEEQWAAAIAPFRSVLLNLVPTHVLVLGQELWGHVDGRRGQTIEIAGRSECVYFADCGVHAAPMLPIRHPSAGFAYDQWHSWISALRAMPVAPA